MECAKRRITSVLLLKLCSLYIDLKLIIMKLDFFHPHDTVLLIGEGNFSFAVCLLKHNLPITVVATCFEDKISYLGQKENIDYLRSKNIPVIFSVDATKLHVNPNFNHKVFSKIVFNFPHVGGKMKIHLNRDLLKKFFKSVSNVIAENDGQVLVSLCQGQGGTPYDGPRKRKWSDSWQITEMAGHGGFVLTRVEPFYREFFKEYSCIGYRSQDVQFNLKGALVHFFEKRTLPFQHFTEKFSIERWNFWSLGKNENIEICATYLDLYTKNPLKISKSPLSFIRDLLLKTLKKFNERNFKIKIYSDDIAPLFNNKTLFSTELIQNKLRRDILDVMDALLLAYDPADTESLVFYSGLCFPENQKNDRFLKSPVKTHFLMIGKEISCVVHRYLRYLIKVFQEKNLEIFEKSRTTDCIHEKLGKYIVKEITEVVCVDSERKELLFSVNYYVRYNGRIINVCTVNADEICHLFFKAFWKDIWAENVQVSFSEEGKPVLKPSLLFPLSYKFDVTLRYDRNDNFSMNEMFDLLWFNFGNLIENVELVNEYDSLADWSSKCYRITYKSWDKPLFKEHILNIHKNLIIPLLESRMNVKVG